MKFFQKAHNLFKQTEKHFKHIRQPNDFSSLANKILSDSSVHEHFNLETIAEFLQYKKYPANYYGLRSFSDMPFTLFRNDHFFLDIYFWRQSDTDIHSHHFTGAFKMLTGQQNQFEFTFQKKKKLFPFLDEGELKMISSRSLRPGETQPILLGQDFIHMTVHGKSQLTANLCLRTPTYPDQHFYGYLLHGHKLLNLPYQEERVQKLGLIQVLSDKDQLKFLAAYLKTQDLFTLISLYKGDLFSTPDFGEELSEITKKIIHKRFPASAKKLEHFLNEMPKHKKLLKKMSFFSQG